MASTKSWLSSPNSNRSPLLSRTSHDLPRWRSPSPMSSTMIPPPIVQSTYGTPQNTLAQSVVVEHASPFEERQNEIQADLQFLLDAQAEGLVRGLEGGEQSSTGSTTPTAQSIRSASSRRRAPPARRRLGLKGARKGLLNSIIRLSTLKDDELVEIDHQIHDDEDTLEKIEGWEKKRAGLQDASQRTTDEEESVRIHRLRQEADALQGEINKAELHLMEMKSRQRKLLKQAAAVENSVQAKLASYTSSLRSLENDIQNFLRIAPDHAAPATSPPAMEPSVWQLPAKRRNLAMAKDYWTEQRDGRLHHRRSVQQERTALVEGAHLWKEAMTEIAEYEQSVRTEMAASSALLSKSTSAWEDPAPAVEETSTGPAKMLGVITRTLASLERKHEVAEERNWKLLVAALGAEMDALQRAKQILDDVVGVDKTEPVGLDRVNDDGSGNDGGNDMRELERSFRTAPMQSPGVEASDPEDEPSPELMFSGQHRP